MKLDKLKKELLSSIEDVCRDPVDLVLDPKRDFTRKRKLPLFEVLRCTVAMGGSSLKHELLDKLKKLYNRRWGIETSFRTIPMIIPTQRPV